MDFDILIRYLLYFYSDGFDSKSAQPKFQMLPPTKKDRKGETKDKSMFILQWRNVKLKKKYYYDSS